MKIKQFEQTSNNEFDKNEFLLGIHQEKQSNDLNQHQNLEEFGDGSDSYRTKGNNTISRKHIVDSYRINEFIEKLGNIKSIPLILGDYKDQFIEGKIEEQLTYNDFMEILSNSLRKIKGQRKAKKNWSKEDLIIFLWVVQKYGLFFDKLVEEYDINDWNEISQIIPGKNAEQCMFKWLGLKRNRFTDKYPWTEGEDSLLKKIVIDTQIRHWFEISKELYLANIGFKVYRNPKQCRQRWACYLNPNIKKGPWTPEEDQILLQKFFELDKKWSQISKFLNGRTENAIKNRFNLIISKSKCKTFPSQIQFAQAYLQDIQLNAFVKIQSNDVQFGLNEIIQNSNEQIVDGSFQEQEDKQKKESINDTQPNTPIDNEKNYDNTFSLYDNKSVTDYTIEDERRNTKIIKFKSCGYFQIMNLKSFITNGLEIYPAYHDDLDQEIVYKEIKPSLKKSVSFETCATQTSLEQVEQRGIEEMNFMRGSEDFQLENL